MSEGLVGCVAAPIIGLTCYLEPASSGVWNVPAVFLPHTYVAPLERAGAVVAVLPPHEPTADRVSAVLDAIDGLSIAGGYDVDPQLYGASRHPQTDAPRTERDAWEAALLVGALERDMPVLGVCRGAQLLNVVRGGTLHQHLPDVVGHDGYQGGDAVFRPIQVSIAPGSTLAAVHPPGRAVPVYHHQAISEVGAGLHVTAVSDDGVIEAVEDPSRSFCVAVQWHPEQDDAQSALYEAFVAASARFAMDRPRRTHQA